MAGFPEEPTMRRTIAALLALSLGFAACNKSEESGSGGGSGASTAGTVAADVAAAKAAARTANGRCPVLVDRLVVADAETRTYTDPGTGRAQTIGFCCDKCPKDFDKDPAKYMKRMRDEPARFGYTLP